MVYSVRSLLELSYLSDNMWYLTGGKKNSNSNKSRAKVFPWGSGTLPWTRHSSGASSPWEERRPLDDFLCLGPSCPRNCVRFQQQEDTKSRTRGGVGTRWPQVWERDTLVATVHGLLASNLVPRIWLSNKKSLAPFYHESVLESHPWSCIPHPLDSDSKQKRLCWKSPSAHSTY